MEVTSPSAFTILNHPGVPDLSEWIHPGGCQNKSEGHRQFFMDYLNVGANGFAQVGDPDYFNKNKIEMNYLLKLIRSKFPVPAELTGLYCYFKVKAFSHDFGTYHEIVLVYDDSKIEEWETS